MMLVKHNGMFTEMERFLFIDDGMKQKVSTFAAQPVDTTSKKHSLLIYAVWI
ncbi:hypothetical protein [Salibacterium salarium]|uniref:hypothetical protein n=1 Tax=Salibacterium salarium TaxID=284579 RepID=UPI00163A8850|nr:hypothetical protein [Salibacterium salarium]